MARTPKRVFRVEVFADDDLLWLLLKGTSERGLPQPKVMAAEPADDEPPPVISAKRTAELFAGTASPNGGTVTATDVVRVYASEHPQEQFTTEQLAELAPPGFKRREVSNACGYLTKAKFLKRVGPGKYQLRAAHAGNGAHPRKLGKRAPKGSIENAILGALANGPLTRSELGKVVNSAGGKPATLGGALYRLEHKAKSISRTSSGDYQLKG